MYVWYYIENILYFDIILRIFDSDVNKSDFLKNINETLTSNMKVSTFSLMSKSFISLLRAATIKRFNTASRFFLTFN